MAIPPPTPPPGHVYSPRNVPVPQTTGVTLKPPRQVLAMQILVWTMAGLLLINATISTLQIAALRRGTEFFGYSEDLEIYTGALILLWLGTILIVGIYVLVFFGVLGGHNWARIVGFVFAGLGILIYVVSLIMDFMHPFISPNARTVVVSILMIGLATAWIVVASLKPTSDYFNLSKQAKVPLYPYPGYYLVPAPQQPPADFSDRM